MLIFFYITDKPKADPGFVEKLTAQIIKNVQIKISDIHIRYEDNVTNPGHPFAMGITLSRLVMESTDDQWNPCIVKDGSTKIYKVCDCSLAFVDLLFYTGMYRTFELVSMSMLSFLRFHLCLKVFEVNYYQKRGIYIICCQINPKWP